MVKMVAMHVVRIMTEPGERASRDGLITAVPPAFKDIAPGTLFEVPDDSLDFLRSSGAIVDPDDKRAAKFGYGTLVGRQAAAVVQEEGETYASAQARRRDAQRTALAEKRESDLVG